MNNNNANRENMRSEDKSVVISVVSCVIGVCCIFGLITQCNERQEVQQTVRYEKKTEAILKLKDKGMTTLQMNCLLNQDEDSCEKFKYEK